ncbi:hypothetical protein [Nostoc sp. CALU 546]|uniref:hypothetical protein n=1 Tax=Nostoc sp. CALU 546 TaxID=1867241 RepID=UPI003B684CB4
MNVDIWKTIVPRPVVIFIYSLIFILALISTTGFINTVLPSSMTPKNLGEVSIKFQYFTEHKDDYDVIFLGPSSTYYGVIPKVFDEFMVKEGKSIKSFNFGIPGANVSEIDFYLKKILALKPANLKWIFVDPLVNFFQFSPTSAKEIYWHTPRKTIENVQLILASNLNWKRKIRYVYFNFKSFIYQSLGIGQLSSVWQEKILASNLLKSNSLEEISEERLIQEAGYYAMDWRKDIEDWKKDFSLRFLDDYKQDLKKASPQNFNQEITPSNTYSLYGIKMIKEIAYKINNQKEISKNKIEPIFFIPPNLEFENNNAIIKAYDLGYIPVLFAFNNPQRFANLYKLDHRIDRVHLNYQGAQELTLAMAEKFSQHLKLSQAISISQN